ncbi:hypothetical protein B0H17DRAFT_1190196 [Mycena rosella]|uniref:Uncharacterized protein n=1 Tax=Mycena rosella TaxID=1033263 RepID=A0AAD7H2H7_MYCRO|nr:hypothetical protein B0H17DRAFT_1190196 [Mycena rosella]
MFNFSKLVFFVLAAAASFKPGLAGPANLVSRAASNVTIASQGPISPEVVLVEVCMDPNFGGGCVSLNFGTVPTGCVSVPNGWNDLITSARAVPGVICTFFADPPCTGKSVVIAGDVPDFRTVGMNDQTTDLSCFST